VSRESSFLFNNLVLLTACFVILWGTLFPIISEYVQGTKVTVAIIPHTAEMTNLASLRQGDPVNLEVDVIAKYVEKMLRGDSGSAITVERLVAQGF